MAIPVMAPLLREEEVAPGVMVAAEVKEDAGAAVLLPISEADMVKETEVVMASLLRTGGLVGLGLSRGVL